jgi:hypothetical protein
MKPTQQELLSLLSYDPLTGIVTWKVSPANRVSAGDVAGSRRLNGRLRICVLKRYYYAASIIWCMVHGYWSEFEIDHIDRNPGNDKLNNLREATRTCQVQNSAVSVRNTSGVKGVSKDTAGKMWRVMIQNKGRQYTIHRGDCFSEAVAHRLAVEQCLGWSSCNSTSTAYLYMKGVVDENRREY